MENVSVEDDKRGWEGKVRKLSPFRHTWNKGVQRPREVQQ